MSLFYIFLEYFKTNFMRTLTLILFFLLASSILPAQNQANNWFFGDGAAITFNTVPPSVITGSQLSTWEGSTSISDANGNLLFYSDGSTVWNSAHTEMANGTGLWGDYSSTQSAIIVPLPGSSTIYYLFTAPEQGSFSPIAYNVIDMTLNNGLGDVTLKNEPLRYQCTEKLTATLHQNGVDYWILGHGSLSNNYYVYHLSSTGLDTVPVVSSLGVTVANDPQKLGYLKVGPCGNTLAAATWEFNNNASTVELFDFDPATGIISNALLLGSFSVQNGVYGLEFSPDNSKLYASMLDPGLILQYDLSAGSPSAIIASMDTVGLSASDFFGALQIAPDGKIYVARNDVNALSCITNPNLQGSACNYITNCISLPNLSKLGLPSFPANLFCNIPSGTAEMLSANSIGIYPNPFTDEVSISVNNTTQQLSSIRIIDLLGREQFYKNDFHLETEVQLHLEFLPPGIYMVEILIGDKKNFSTIVKATDK